MSHGDVLARRERGREYDLDETFGPGSEVDFTLYEGASYWVGSGTFHVLPTGMLLVTWIYYHTPNQPSPVEMHPAEIGLGPYRMHRRCYEGIQGRPAHL